MGFRPSKWVLYAPVAVLPLLAAVFLQGRGLQDDIATRVTANLSSAGIDWAKAGVQGRDVQLAGDAPSADQVDAAIATSLSTYGVRRVVSIMRVVEPPPAAPVIAPRSGIWGTFTIGGTFPEGNGNSLSVNLAGESWTLGKDSQLASDGSGNWTLKPDLALEPGTYDVTANVTSASGLVSSDASKDEITVIAPPVLSAPAIESLESASARPVVRGTWDPSVATSLAVSIGATVYKSGVDAALATDGGKWSLAVPWPLADGSYDVMAEVGDALGRVVKAAAPAKLLIDTTPPVAPVINPMSSEWPARVTGTWPDQDGVALKATLAGKTWTFGKDAALSSDAPGNWTLTPDSELSPGTYDLAIEIADKLGNVSRDATKDEITIVAPPVLPAPTVESLLSNSATPGIKGTWPSDVANALAVKLADKVYVLGTAGELTADGDNWRLKLAAPLADGDYAVSAEVHDKRGRAMASVAPGKLSIDTVAPVAPTVAPFAGEPPLQVTGTWAEGDALSLVVRLADKLWTLGQDAGLASDGKGKWSFAPELDLAPGTYDLGVEITDRAGNVSRDATKDEITIVAPPPPPPPPPVMEVPAVTAAEETVARPIVKGTWSEIAAKSLEVAIGGMAFELGGNAELTSDGIGNWSLALPSPLDDGTYDVSVGSTDASGKSLSDTTRNELVIDAKGPATPTVKLYAGEASPDHMSGSWDWQNATSLTVSVPAANIAASLGGGPALTTAADGWILALSGTLPPGSYDVVVETADKRGRVSKDQTRFELLVKQPPPPPPPVLSAPTIESLESASARPVVRGTWDPSVATSLAVSIGATVYKSGVDAALATDGGKWSLAVPWPLADGSYDVMAEVGDALGRVVKAAAPAKLLIDTTPPVAPVINPMSSEWPARVTGTWPDQDGVALKATLAGKTWTFGKDAALSSDAPGNWTLTPDSELSPGTYDLAIEIADKLGNVSRDATKDEITIVAPPVLPAPTVESLLSNSATPGIKGTWPSDVANALAVKLADKVYVLGTAGELTADGDNWRLKLAAPLADGDYAVSAEVHDKRGRAMASVAPGKLSIDTVAPVAPTVAPFAGEPPLQVTGTWAEGDALSLVVRLADKLWTLGQDAGLASDGKGKWSFAPELDLAPGTYDLGVEITDRAGNVSRDATKDEITIVAPPPPPPPPPVMEVPAVTAAEETVARPIVKGTWSEIAAKSLEVAIGGMAFELGGNAELTSDGIGNWSLALPSPLDDGTYDVSVGSTDASGKSLSDTTRNELVIDAKGPATPTVKLYAGEASPDHMSGSWDWQNATSLTVSVPAANIAASLGGGPALTTAADGWILALSGTLPPGSYDVVVETADKRGRVSKDQTRFELLVKQPPPPPPPAMKAPTVASYSGVETPAAITGTWDEVTATRLSVAIAGASLKAVLGSDTALTSDANGNWNLALSTQLAPGLYEVTVETVDAQGNRIADASTGELGIKDPPPPMKAPTVTFYSGEESPAAVTGSWDEAVAQTLGVSVAGAGVSAVLGSDAALTSDGMGNWTLALSTPLSPGTYDVVAETADGQGNRVTDASSAELVIKTPPPPPPPPYDCEAVFESAIARSSIRFAFDRWDLTEESLSVVAAAAVVLNDERCLDRNVEVTGNADYFGGRLYNEALSIRRAQVVVEALQAANVSSSRLRVTGQGEGAPEIPDRTRAARAQNRRVILTMYK